MKPRDLMERIEEIGLREKIDFYTLWRGKAVTICLFGHESQIWLTSSVRIPVKALKNLFKKEITFRRAFVEREMYYIKLLESRLKALDSMTLEEE